MKATKAILILIVQQEKKIIFSVATEGIDLFDEETKLNMEKLFLDK